MSSPPPPSYLPSAAGGHKRRISYTSQSQKKPKTHSALPSPQAPQPSRKNSISIPQHPLRQTSFPPERVVDRGVERAESVIHGGGSGAKDDDEEDEGRDDYGTETVLADGGTGGFVEDDEEKKKMAFVFPSPLSPLN